jgi:hypothetical protein
MLSSGTTISTQGCARIVHVRPQAGQRAPCALRRLIRQRAAYEGMPAGISRSKINTTLAQLLVLSDHLDQIIGTSPRLMCACIGILSIDA